MKIHKIRFSVHLLLLALFLSACGAGEPPTQEVTPTPLTAFEEPLPVQIILYTPKNMMNDNILSQFDEDANISVIQKYYTTDEDLTAMVNEPPGTISLIVATNYAASTLQSQELLAPLDPANIPNLTNLDTRFRNLSYDPNNQFCAPFAYNTIGIGYINGQGIAPASWGDLFRLTPGSPAYGRTTLLDHPRETIGAALIHLGYSPNTIDETEIEEAKQLILQAADSFDSLDSFEYSQRLATFETTLAQGVSREFLHSQQVNSDMNYALPEEGALLQIYSFCIPTFTLPNHKKAAEIFINLNLDQASAASSVFNLQLSTTVMLDENQVALDAEQTPFVFPPKEVIDQAQYIYALGTSEILYTTAWEEIANAIR